jgi:pimeloyl-ACP methyl ester carboxylesterase
MNQIKLEYYQNELLKELKIPYTISKVYLDNNNDYINTLHIKSIDRPILVIIHGFASGLATFVSVYEKLYNIYDIYAIDLIGYGLSSKPIFSNDYILSETLFIDSIEAWRIKLNLKSIIICAHSFGCYVSTNYYNKYPDNVKALILVEPWNFSDNRINNYSIIQKLPIFNFINLLKTFQPISYYFMFIISYYICSKISKHLKNKNNIFNYIYYLNISSTADIGFFSIIDNYFYPKKPLQINNPDLPLFIIYGEETWLDIKSGIKFAYNRNKHTKLYILPNAAHEVFVEQLHEFTSIIINLRTFIRNL